MADDGITGRELWAVDDVLSDVLFADGFEGGDLKPGRALDRRCRVGARSGV